MARISADLAVAERIVAKHLAAGAKLDRDAHRTGVSLVLQGGKLSVVFRFVHGAVESSRFLGRPG